jgi:hypothetical protein
MSPAASLLHFKAGSCIVCGYGTDTGLAFQGEPEWCIAGLVVLGLDAVEAEATFRTGIGRGPNDLVPGFATVTYRVCAACVAKTPFPAPVLILSGAEVPCIRAS